MVMVDELSVDGDEVVVLFEVVEVFEVEGVEPGVEVFPTSCILGQLQPKTTSNKIIKPRFKEFFIVPPVKFVAVNKIN
jgi:hypothetical protein